MYNVLWNIAIYVDIDPYASWPKETVANEESMYIYIYVPEHVTRHSPDVVNELRRELPPVTSLNFLWILLGRVWQTLIGLPNVNC